MKKLWKGIFVFNRETYIIYRQAHTKRQAWVIFCRNIAKKQGVIPSQAMNYFNGDADNFSIQVETEFKETE